MGQIVYLADIGACQLTESARAIAWWLGAFRPSSVYEPPNADRIMLIGLDSAEVEPTLQTDLHITAALSKPEERLTRQKIFCDTIRGVLPRSYAERYISIFDFEENEIPENTNIIDIRDELASLEKLYNENKKDYGSEDFLEMSMREIADENITPLLNEATAQRGRILAQLENVDRKMEVLDTRVADISENISKMVRHLGL